MVLRKCEILLVDDDTNDIELALLAFKRCGLDSLVYAVSSGEEALECFGAWAVNTRMTGRHPRLVILDLKMPKIDGFAVLTTIRQTPEISAVPVVFLTSSRMPADIEKAYKLGCNAYVVKPVAHQEYMQTLESLISFWCKTNLVPND